MKLEEISKVINVVIIEDNPEKEKSIRDNVGMPGIFKDLVMVKTLPELESKLTELKDINPETKLAFWIHIRFDEMKKKGKTDFEELTRTLRSAISVKYPNIKLTFITEDNSTGLPRDTVITFSQVLIYLIENKVPLLTVEKALQTESVPHISAIEDIEEDDSLLSKPIAEIQDFEELSNLCDNDFGKLKEYLNHCDLHGKSSWIEALFSGNQNLNEISKLFNLPYWDFPSSIYYDYFDLNKIKANSGQDIPSPTILQYDEIHKSKSDKVKSLLQSKEVIVYFPNTPKIGVRRWYISFSFFNALKQGSYFRNTNSVIYERIFQATRLYLLHEAVHQIHCLDSDTVLGIGSFPRIVEEVDYQADAIAIITELSYILYQAPNITAVEFFDKAESVIKTAIETTFSFNPVRGELKAIQIRRVNRYLIWFWQIKKIEKLRESNLYATNQVALIEILKILSQKPMLEIAGPAIINNKSRDRVLYKLGSEGDIIHEEEMAQLVDNKIKRIGGNGVLNFKKLYEGLRKSNYNIISDFFDPLKKL